LELLIEADLQVEEKDDTKEDDNGGGRECKKRISSWEVREREHLIINELEGEKERKPGVPLTNPCREI
jgi:hypothetical protein